MVGLTALLNIPPTYLITTLVLPTPENKMQKQHSNIPAFSVYQKINFLISQPKHRLWILKRTVSMRRFFCAPKTYVQTEILENIYNFTIKNFVNLNLWTLNIG